MEDELICLTDKIRATFLLQNTNRWTGDFPMRILHTADWHLGKIVNDFSMLDDQTPLLDEAD